ncbi:MAG TPA: rhodanese-like domain-containing protein, partial [Enteractinococcus sp.]
EVAEQPVPFATTHVPFDQLASFAPQPGRRIVTICRSGPRSIRAALHLAAAGHDVVGYVDGGVLALSSETSLP